MADDFFPVYGWLTTSGGKVGHYYDGGDKAACGLPTPIAFEMRRTRECSNCLRALGQWDYSR